MFLRCDKGEYELVIKRSRFIAYSIPIERRDDVKAEIERLKAEHSEARHVCYGFVADEAGLDFGYDDNGEPQGTAGKPIYTAIENSNVKKTLVAVVRYFGGIKLGAGGLTRAYREAAAGVIEKAGIHKAERFAVYSVNCDGDAYGKKISQFLRNSLCKTESIVYNERVQTTIVAPLGVDLAAALSPFGAAVERIGERTENI